MRSTIAVLGAGPAGLALAMKLLERRLPADVIVLEQGTEVGGLAASFKHQDLTLDFGSHRLHPATSARVMSDIRRLLGDDLLRRPRNGRIRLLGRFVKFPLRPFDLLRRLPPSFMCGVVMDSVAKPWRRTAGGRGSFADVLLGSLGPTICRNFYFPYARKLWGLDPFRIAAEQARRRVSANSIGKMVRKVLAMLPGFKAPGTGVFYYPRQGYGQICRGLAKEVERLGGRVVLNARVTGMAGAGAKWTLKVERTAATPGNGPESVAADLVFSTIPITILAKLITPAAPPAVTEALQALRYRGMILCYLVLGVDRFTPYDAHYFPETGIVFSRISEPKNYSGDSEPRGKTALCIEIPAAIGDSLWALSDDAILRTALDHMDRVGLPARHLFDHGLVRRVPYVYPQYDLEYEKHLNTVEGHLRTVSGIVALGRQGLFAHDNTHHTMETAYGACDCVDESLMWNATHWDALRARFKSHIVED